jgi:hypothetical protein
MNSHSTGIRGNARLVMRARNAIVATTAPSTSATQIPDKPALPWRRQISCINATPAA